MSDTNNEDQKNINLQGSVPASGISGNLSKETEPIHTAPSLSEQAIEVSKELREMGVELVSEAPKLTQEQADAGIRVSDTLPSAQKTQTQAPSDFIPPLTDQEIILAKKSPVSSAFHWFGGVVKRQIDRLRFNKQKTSSKSV